MALRGKKPEAKAERLKLMMFGPAGVGKTTAAIQMPRPYVIDTEGGTDHYGEMIEDHGGAVFQTNDLDEVEDEVRALMTEDHPYRTLVLDPFTALYETQLEKGEREVGSEFGRHYGYANKTCKRLFNLLTTIDMNVVVTCHAKNEYGDGMKVVGQTFDGWKKLDYAFDLVIQLDKKGARRVGRVRKTRLKGFPDGDVFEWTLDAIAERFDMGSMTREAEAATLASPEDVARLKGLVATLHLDDDVVGKWLSKAKVACIEDMPAEAITACIEWCESKVKEAA